MPDDKVIVNGKEYTTKTGMNNTRLINALLKSRNIRGCQNKAMNGRRWNKCR